jgi:hypothetical protein
MRTDGVGGPSFFVCAANKELIFSRVENLEKEF